MPDQSLGTISAMVRLSLTQLGVDVQLAKGLMGELGASMQQHAAGFATSIGSGMAVAGAAVLAGLGEATKVAADFDQGLRNVDSIAKLTGQQFNELHDNALKIAEDPKIRQGPVDLAKSLYDIYSSGASGGAALEDLKQSAIGASAGMTDTATSSKVLMAVLNSGISGVNSAKEAMDVLFREVDLGVNTFGELATTLGDVLPTAQNAGISLQEISAGLAVMTRGGISAAESVTALNNLIIQAVKPQQHAAELMHSLGIEYGIAALESKGLAGWLAEVIEKTRGNKQAMMELMPEHRAMKALLSLSKNEGKDFNEMLAGMSSASKGAGSAMAALDRQNQGAAAQFEILKKDVQILAIQIGEVLLPYVRGLVTGVQDLVNVFVALPDWVKQGVVVFAALAAGAVTLGGVILVAAGAFATMSAAAVAAGTTLGAVAAAFWPVGLAIAGGIAALALFAAAWNHDFLRIRSIVTGFMHWVEPFIRIGWAHTVEAVKQLWNDMVSAGRAAFVTLQTIVATMMSSITGTIQNGVNTAVGALRALNPMLGAIANTAVTAVGTAISNSADAVVNRVHDTIGAMKAVSDTARQLLNQTTGGGAGGGRHGLGGGGGGHHGGGKGGAAGALDDIKQKAEEANRAIKDTLDSIYKLTHNEFDVRRRQALDAFYDRRKSGVPVGLATQELGAEAAAISKDEAAFRAKGEKQANLISTETKEAFEEISKAIQKAVDEDERFNIVSRETADAWQKIGNAIRTQGIAASASEAISKLTGGFDFGSMASKASAYMTKTVAAYEESARVRYEIDHRDYREYLKILEQKIAATRIYSEEWRKLYEEIGGIVHANAQKPAKEAEGQFGRWRRVMHRMADTMTEVFENAFTDLFHKGWGKFFQDVLQGFVKMLEKMVAELLAKAAIFGILNVLTGGSFGAAQGGLGKFLGFDDWGNDRKAQHWGSDYADHFTRGIKEFAGRNVPAGGGRAASVQPITVHMSDIKISHEMDIRDVANKLAWHLQTRGVQYQGTG